MSNFSIGIDIVEHDHMKDKITDKFVMRILSTKELEVYNNISSSKRKVEYISSRFAAKESIFKAFILFFLLHKFNGKGEESVEGGYSSG